MIPRDATNTLICLAKGFPSWPLQGRINLAKQRWPKLFLQISLTSRWKILMSENLPKMIPNDFWHGSRKEPY